MNSSILCLFNKVCLGLVAFCAVGCALAMDIQQEPPALQRDAGYVPDAPKVAPAKQISAAELKELKNTPQPMQRGVAQGVLTNPYKQFNNLQTFGIYLADSREGTHVILPGDRLFVRTVPDVVIQPDFYVALNALVDVLNTYKEVKISVIGHTTDTMSPRMQSEVSLNEARVVADYLSASGVSPARIQRVEGRGDRQPIAQKNDFEGRQLNRRVEVIVNAPLS